MLALKADHSTVYAEVKTFLEDARQRRFAGVAHDVLETTEKEHGRVEVRRYWITDQIHWFADRADWENLRPVAMVEAERHVGDKVSVERRFYLCSLPPDAKLLAHAVRSHWGIENQLHWVLDVQMGEDQCRIRAGHAAQNLATLRHIVLNLQRRNPCDKLSIQAKQLQASWDHATSNPSSTPMRNPWLQKQGRGMGDSRGGQMRKREGIAAEKFLGDVIKQPGRFPPRGGGMHRPARLTPPLARCNRRISCRVRVSTGRVSPRPTVGR